MPNRELAGQLIQRLTDRVVESRRLWMAVEMRRLDTMTEISQSFPANPGSVTAAAQRALDSLDDTSFASIRDRLACAAGKLAWVDAEIQLLEDPKTRGRSKATRSAVEKVFSEFDTYLDEAGKLIDRARP
ncbi:MAG: hypothetical protein GC168_10225 [Candidatus Hydrogenedens sp.]|nr:hypothetical protein [Candidatus Hydrogenedens sp.]